MSIVRQMPQLLLRGSLANITMANLTEAERVVISDTMTKVASHPSIIKHKNKFVKELGDTIGADYKDDRAAAEEEFYIVIWRATVNLLYHRKYSFECASCGEVSYKNKKQKTIIFDRQYPFCPNCGVVRIIHQGETNYQVNSYVDNKEFQDSYKDFLPTQDMPKCESPIKYIPGENIYKDPYKVLEDDRQLVKFYCEFIWNYLRQTLKENNRVEHRKTAQLISGSADYIIVEEIVSLCSGMKIDFSYCSKTQPENGYYNIIISSLQTPPEFTCEFIKLYEKASNHGVSIECGDYCIRVKKSINAPTIEANVVKPEHVLIFDNSNSDDETQAIQVSYRTIRMQQMQQEDHVSAIDTQDVIEIIRQSLPDGQCKQVFDIWAGKGQTYIDFSNEFGDGKPCINHIARYLNITARSVNQYKETIKVCCLAHGLTPD